MIELERHIEILLLSNDCVIVPTLGGFMAHHVDARYDENDNMFLPPLRTLGFNPQLKLNDSLLAQSYVEAYDISYPEAIRRIEGEVRELKQRLDNEGCYELNDIGTLYLNDEGNYQFEPCEAGILTPGLYGLSSFEMRRIATDAGQDATDEKPVMHVHVKERKAVETKKNSVKAEQKVMAEDSHEAEDDDNFIKIKVAWLRNAVAVAAAIVAFLVITTPISNSDKSNLYMSNMQTDAMMRLMPKDTNNGTIKITKAQIKESARHSDTIAAKQAKADAESAKADTEHDKDEAETQSRKDAKGYCIVMASHVTRTNAETYVNELHDCGYDQAHTYIHNNVVRVVYGNYTNQSEAYATLRTIRGNKYFEQAWVYKKR